MNKTQSQIISVAVFLLGLFALLGAGWMVLGERDDVQNLAGKITHALPFGDSSWESQLWVAEGMRGQVSFQTDASNQSYEIIYRPQQIEASVLFSRGTYSYDEEAGVLTLYPRQNVQAPAVREGRETGFLNLRSYKIPMRHDRRQKTMVWTGGQRQGHVRRDHPLFVRLNPKSRKIIWQHAKRAR